MGAYIGFENLLSKLNPHIKSFIVTHNLRVKDIKERKWVQGKIEDLSIKKMHLLYLSFSSFFFFLFSFFSFLFFLDRPNFFLRNSNLVSGTSLVQLFCKFQRWMLKGPPLIPRDYISRASKISPREGH